MKKDMLSAKNDLIFKTIFGNSSNNDILIDFLKSILDIPHDDYDTITIVDPNLRIEKEKDKLGILDLKLKTKSNRIINIEIQLHKMKYMTSRALFYTSKLITEQINQSERYEVIKKVVSILILNYDMIKDKPKYNHKFLLYDKTDDTELTDLLEVHVLELEKLPKESDNTSLYNWLSFFTATEREEFEMLKEKSEELKKAVVILEQLSEDEQTRMLAEAIEKKRRDEYERLRTAELDGIEQGIKQGIEQGIKQGVEQGEKLKSIEIAKNMLKGKVDIESVSAFTSLTIEELIEIQKEL